MLKCPFQRVERRFVEVLSGVAERVERARAHPPLEIRFGAPGRWPRARHACPIPFLSTTDERTPAVAIEHAPFEAMRVHVVHDGVLERLLVCWFAGDTAS
jgi:hypothetical protein